MLIVIDKIMEVFALPPALSLPGGSIGAKKPSGGTDTPAVTISLAIDDQRGAGIGWFLRTGEKAVQSSAVIEGRATSEIFSRDLKSLRLEPIPLKGNSASVGEIFTEQDVRVRKVTDPASPVLYRMKTVPVQQDEYRLDVPRARIIFGKPQNEGDKLAVVHWTGEGRNDIQGERYSGKMSLDIWGTH